MTGGHVVELSSRRTERHADPGFLARAMAAASKQMGQALCGLGGHFLLLHYERDKLSLQCSRCGYESPGWDVAAPPHGISSARGMETYR